MTDVHNPEVRSKNMRAIRSVDTKPELIIRKSLHAAGLRFRLGGAGLPGRPDLVLPKHKTAIFVHGCFWHGHECKFFKVPQTRTDFWLQKIGANKVRDHSSSCKLLELGWNVIIIWECVTRKADKAPSSIVTRVRAILSEPHPFPSLSIIE
jgi:DNA mismatch endonuclease (patch repair protein)